MRVTSFLPFWRRRIFLVVTIVAILSCGARSKSDKKEDEEKVNGWLATFGHDTWTYPLWIEEQRDACTCTFEEENATCVDSGVRNPGVLTWCVAMQWLLDHMPEFDKYFLPPSVSVNGRSLLDDNIAFALMAENVSSFSQSIPLNTRLAYILPYASYHEARVNWRPLFFAKFYDLVKNAKSTRDAMSLLVAPNVFTNWTGHLWPAHPLYGKDGDYTLQWASSTSPPVINPFGFAAYGYASCSGWATLLTYVARSMGIPARQVGSPCWNTIYEGVDYRGLAKDNSNVSICWNGGIGSSSGEVGGSFLNNHNWVEYFDSEASEWVFQNVPPTTATPDGGGPCASGSYTKGHGCDWNNETGCSNIARGPGLAARDHEIYAITWEHPSDDAVIDVQNLRLSSGEPVSPLVWSPRLTSPLGTPLKNVGLRVLNRTSFYRCAD